MMSELPFKEVKKKKKLAGGDGMGYREKKEQMGTDLH